MDAPALALDRVVIPVDEPGRISDGVVTEVRAVRPVSFSEPVASAGVPSPRASNPALRREKPVSLFQPISLPETMLMPVEFQMLPSGAVTVPVKVGLARGLPPDR